MSIISFLFGDGNDLNVLQMSCRGFVMFIISLVLIRVSGRRSFGIRTPLDNIIVILLGAVLSRAVVGASAFLPVVTCSLVIVLSHRCCGWLIVHNKFFARMVEGDKILLFEDGRFIKRNMDKALVCEEDIMQGVRKSALTDDLGKIAAIYMERSGTITAIKK